MEKLTSLILAVLLFLPCISHSAEWKKITPDSTDFNRIDKLKVISYNGSTAFLALADYRILTCQPLNQVYLYSDFIKSWKNIFGYTSNYVGCVSKLEMDRAGNIYAIGKFNNSSNQNLFRLVLNNNIEWVNLTEHTNLNITTMATDPTGIVYIAASKSPILPPEVYRYDVPTHAWLSLQIDNIAMKGPITSMAVDNYGNVYASIATGLYVYLNKSKTWFSTNYKIISVNNEPDSILIDSKNNLYILDINAQIQKSHDGCLTWVTLKRSTNDELIREIVLDSKNNLYAAGTHGIIELEENKSNWTTFPNSALTKHVGVDNAGNIYAVFLNTANVYQWS